MQNDIQKLFIYWLLYGKMHDKIILHKQLMKLFLHKKQNNRISNIWLIGNNFHQEENMNINCSFDHNCITSKNALWALDKLFTLYVCYLKINIH
jgi:hypothetical protein